MSEGSKHDAQLEIAHVLFIDIVGYSKLLTSEQRERQRELNAIVRETEPFRAAEAADKLVRIPTGDGMVLAFFTKPDAPARCAMAISRALHGTAHLPLRMGIHSGPVELVEDVNDKPNLAGAGVNIAQRVMDCGDAGHILLSARAADDLAEHAEWNAQLHELGEVEVKHGVRVRIASLHSNGFGNPGIPQKVRRQHLVRKRRWIAISTAFVALIAGIAIATWAWQRQAKLRAQATAESAKAREKSVAVLPFENLSTDDPGAVFANGVHREVLSNLAKIAALKVISRTSVQRYKPGSDRKVKQIAEELGVVYLVEGTVQREAQHVRVTVELIDARSETQAWAETYDGNIADVLGFQTEIAQRITNQLGAKLSPRESTDLASRPTQDIAAFESYIRARTLMEATEEEDDADKFRDDQARAVQLLEQAVARDPKFVAADWALAEANTQLFRSDAEKVEFRARAETAIKDAYRLAPEAGETLHADARLIYYGQHDFHRALAKLEESAKVLPNSAEVTTTRALLYRRFGRWQEAYVQFLRAADLNPQDPFNYGNAASVACALRWYDDAESLRRRIVKKFPRLERTVRAERALWLRLRGEPEAGDRLFKELSLDVRTGFTPLFYMSSWRRDFGECRRLLNEAANYPDLESERWDKELQLVFVTKCAFDERAAQETEKRLEANLGVADQSSETSSVPTLGAVKMLLGKRQEAVHLFEELVQKHPLAKDAFVNVGPMKSLAQMYLFAGDNERAIKTLEELVKIPNALWYGPLRNDPVFDPLRNDPRFKEILKQSQQPFPRI